jgi:hypothetical protein
MSDSPLSPQEIRAAAAAHAELGPEYNDAVVASFLDQVDRAVAARVDARMAEMGQAAPPAEPEDRRTLLKGMAIGVSLSGIALVAVGGNPFERMHRVVVVLMILAVVCALGATWDHRQRRRHRQPARPAPFPASDQRTH